MRLDRYICNLWDKVVDKRQSLWRPDFTRQEKSTVETKEALFEALESSFEGSLSVLYERIKAMGVAFATFKNNKASFSAREITPLEPPAVKMITPRFCFPIEGSFPCFWEK